MKLNVSFERLNSKNFLVKFEKKHWWSKKKVLMKEEIMSEDELQEFIKENNVHITSIESNRHNGFTDTLNRYREHKEKGISLAGERVVIDNVKAIYTEEEGSIKANILFDVIGADSQKLIGHKRVEVFPLNQKVKDGGLEVIYTHLFQLYYSGCHATREDEQNCLIAYEKLNQSHKK